MLDRFSRFRDLFVSAVLITVLFAGCTSAPEKPGGEDISSETAENQVVEQPEEQIPEETIPLAEQLSAVQSVDNLDQALAVLVGAESLTIEEQILKASLEIAEQKLAEAGRTLDSVLKEEPENTDAIYTLALLRDAEGDEEDRDFNLKKALSFDPVHSDSLIFQGMIFLGKRDYNHANSNFTNVLKTQPDNFLALSGAATAQMNLDNLEESIELLDRAIELEPDYAYLYVDRARAWKGLKKYGKAEDSLTEAIKLEPDVEWHYLDRARIRIQYFHDLEGAWEDLIKLDNLNPENFFAHVYMAGILDDWKRYDEAEEYYLKVIAARPNYGFAHEPLAKIAYMDGRYDDARKHFLQAYDFEQRDVSYLLAAAVCMEKMNDRRSAEKMLKELAPRVPRGTLEYEMFRYYLSPGSDFFIMDKIKKEENEDLQSRMYFYLGARYDLSGLRQSALAAYGNVMEKSEFFESDLAGWELNRPAQ